MVRTVLAMSVLGTNRLGLWSSGVVVFFSATKEDTFSFGRKLLLYKEQNGGFCLIYLNCMLQIKRHDGCVE